MIYDCLYSKRCFLSINCAWNSVGRMRPPLGPCSAAITPEMLYYILLTSMGPKAAVSVSKLRRFKAWGILVQTFSPAWPESGRFWLVCTKLHFYRPIDHKKRIYLNLSELCTPICIKRVLKTQYLNAAAYGPGICASAVSSSRIILLLLLLTTIVNRVSKFTNVRALSETVNL